MRKTHSMFYAYLQCLVASVLPRVWVCLRDFIYSPPARWGLLDFMSVACSSPPLLSSSSCSTATLDAQCSLSDLNHDHPRPVFPAGPQPRPSPPSVPCRTSTTTIHAQCSLPDLNREYPRQVFPAGPHVGRYGTKNVQKKVRKNVRQVCYILLANSRVCGRVTGAMPLSDCWSKNPAFDFGSGGPLACFSHVFTNMFDRRCADMFGHVCLFGSGGPLACLVMFKQTCWELWRLLHMAHWHVYILFDRLTCTMTCQVKQMIGIVSWAKVPWQKLQTKVVSTSCFEMSWWGSLEAK